MDAKQAAEAGAGVPHYDQIESHAHQCGQRLSQLMQQTRTADVVAEARWQQNSSSVSLGCRELGREPARVNPRLKENTLLPPTS